MSEIETFFRHCPACGRRFEVRLVGKKVVSDEEHESEAPVEVPTALRSTPALFLPVTLDEEVPTLVNRDEFQYSYVCKHCGHRWLELRTKTNEMNRPKGYEGD